MQLVHIQLGSSEMNDPLTMGLGMELPALSMGLPNLMNLI